MPGHLLLVSADIRTHEVHMHTDRHSHIYIKMNTSIFKSGLKLYKNE